MFKLSLRNIWSRKGRLLLTAIAVIAGTAFLSGVFVFTDTIKGSFNEMFASAYANTDAFVRSSNVIEGEFGEETRDRIDVALVDEVRAVSGVTEAYGDVFGTATVSFEDKVVGQDGPPKFAGAWIDSENSPWSLAEGRAPAADNEVVIDRASSKTAKIELGDTVSITTISQPRDFTVVGIATFAGNDSSGGASWSLFTLPTAQEFVIGDTSKVDNVIVVGDGTEEQQVLADRVSEALDQPEVEVLTGQQITEENQSAVETSLSFITIFLSVFALISLFVGSFIIYNVFSISAAQRQRENALLRAVGASRSQITRSMFIEAMVVGIGGSLLGCIGGIGLATGILGLLSAVGFGPGDTSLVLNPTGFIVTLVVGILVTVVCAIAPAIRSGRVPPLAAMRDVAIDHADASRTRKIVGGLALVGAVVLVAMGLSGNTLALGGGAAGLFLALIALGPFVATPVANLASPVLTKFRGASGTMAGRNAARNPKRTALTAGALAVGLSLLIGVATLGASAKATTKDVIGRSFSSDYVVSPKQGNNGIGIPATVADDLKAAEVGDVLGLAATAINVEEDGELRSKQVVALNPDDAQAVLDITFITGGFDALTPDGILVATDKASRDGLEVGDVISTQMLDGAQHELTVEGIFDSDVFGNLIVDRALFDDSPVPLFDLGVFIKAEGGVTEANTAALQKVIDGYPTAKLQSRDQYIDEQSEQIDGFLNFIYALLGMSIFIAIIGIVITLMLAVYERRRELGLLRAVGMTRRQVRSSVLWESMITAVVGVITGTVLGVTLGWIIVKALEDEGLSVFSLPVSTIAVAAVLALVFAAGAAVYPARRAAKADVLEAIATT
ncbi:MAG: ABC transporter permease [Actinobacteria bacterium]|nr:ABC transporter permease [Actinomycetota bacterium]